MQARPIPLSNPKASYEEHRQQIEAAVSQFFASGVYILGDQTRRFEAEFARLIGRDYCVTVNNGTDAIQLALQALGVGAGDEVITVSHTAVATVAAIELAGAIPVFADVDPVSYCLDPNQLAGLLSEKTKAILPVHLYGHPADMPAIMAFARQHGLLVIEDCAQAHGASLNGQLAGSFGDAACFSFYPTKNLGAFGDGGAVLTNDPEIAEKLLLLRQYGWKNRYISEFPGMNTRMDELQAALLNLKLPYLENDNQRRARIANYYNDALKGTGLGLPGTAASARHVWHLYVVQTDQRDQLQAYLRQNLVSTGIHYPLAVHQQPAYRERLRGCGNLPVTEALIPRILSLPIYPQLPLEDVDRVCQLIWQWREICSGN